MFPKAPVRIGEAFIMIKGGRSNRIIIRKMFDAEKKELTESKFLEKLSPVNTP